MAAARTAIYIESSILWHHAGANFGAASGRCRRAAVPALYDEHKWLHKYRTFVQCIAIHRVPLIMVNDLGEHWKRRLPNRSVRRRFDRFVSRLERMLIEQSFFVQ